jgi:hypothetical protein
MQVCADGDLGGGCGSDGTSFYIYDKYQDKKEQGVTTYWDGLTNGERNSLSNNGWNSDIWKDAIGGPGVTKADILHDPALLPVVMVLIARSPMLVEAGLVACYTSSVCNNLFLGIQPYNEMPTVKGFERHHLLEQRFARSLGIDPKLIPSIYHTPGEHDVITSIWRRTIGYRGDVNFFTTPNATREVLWDAVQNIYKGSPEYIEAIRRILWP